MMIATDILDALWKRKGLVAFFLSVSLLACHLCLFMKQSHTAVVYIKYMESRASEGVATNGQKLDPYEISDPYIVGKALEQLGMADKNANNIAQKIKVTPVISTAEQEKYASWIDEFSDYEKTEDEKATPIYYRIELKSQNSLQFSRSFLSALVQQYRNYYTEKYSDLYEVTLIPESVVMNSDYYYSVELLQSQMEGVRASLREIQSADTNYRSPVTDYSVYDLAEAYDLLLSTDVASVMQYILDSGVSKDIQTLVASLQQSADAALLESDEKIEKANTQKEMMLLYAEKNKEYVSTLINPDENEDQVYGDVDRDKSYEHNFTTYDQLMLDYVEFAVKSENLLIDKAYLDENISKFGEAALEAVAPIEEISDIYEQYVELMNITRETLDGYNAFKSARTILQVSGIKITETLPELMYYTVSGILGLCLGCGFVLITEIQKNKVNHGKKEKNLFDGVL